MSLFDECCVLIPAATLEDFPSDLSDYEARSLLAAWTVLWDPRLLADSEQLPVWYRADAPPDPIGRRLFTVPAPSVAQLPDHYEMRVRQSQECRWITGGCRAEMLAEEMIGELKLGESQLGQLPPPLEHEGRHIAAEDFYAAGYACLQIQVMTRRLRYTSNLDEIHLQNRIVAAAKSFLDRDAQAAAEALHDVFDCLAEERDHYFSSDPHLIDLTLTSTSTVDSLLQMLDRASAWETAQQDASNGQSGGTDHAGLPTPQNVLVDCEVAQAIAAGGHQGGADQSKEAPHPVLNRLASGEVGWAGGGPPADTCLDVMTFAQAESVFRDAYRRTQEAIGAPPQVYARFSGATPSDMTQTLAKLGYCGIIPLDFENGTGHGDEAKVIMQSAGSELEALTAKPIDASSDASFLTLGTRLGEAIDSGEIATGLLAHWPGQTSDSFQDLKRVASWSLALGKFWRLADYFRDGEHPYHHGTARATSPDAAHLLERLVTAATADPISSPAAAFRNQVAQEQRHVLTGMARLVTGQDVEPADAASHFAAAVVGADAGDAKQSGVPPGRHGGWLLINPHAAGCRETVTLAGATPAPAKHIYAATQDDDVATATVDIPGCGFVLVRGGDDAARQGPSWGAMIRGKLFGSPRSMAQQWSLHNEFMEVTISPESGGISGVYSGGIRGNRFSMRLVANGHQGPRQPAQHDSETLMRCSQLRVVTSTAASGCIEAQGEITDAGGSTIATYELRYTLFRGSRIIHVAGELVPQQQLSGNPWQHNYAARVAVVTPSAIYRPMLRDKLHRARSRRLVAPLGLVVDEAERQTLISADGRPFHRCVGERFVDTLLWVQGESNPSFKLSYGFDVPAPVAVARALLAPPLEVPINGAPGATDAGATDIGWVVHAAPKEILIADFNVGRRRDGRLAAIVRVIQTRSKSCKATVRFLRDVQAAALLAGSTLCPGSDDPLNLPLPPSGSDSSKQAGTDESDSLDDGPYRPQWLTWKDDSLAVSLPGHAVADILVVFVDDANAQPPS